MKLDIPYEIGEYKKHREDPNHETVCKDSWVCDYLGKYVAEVERLKVENETLEEEKSELIIKVSGLRVTSSNLQINNKDLREALEKMKAGHTMGTYLTSADMIHIAEEALKGGE